MPAVLLPTAIFAATVTTITVTKRSVESKVASGGMIFYIFPVFLSQKAEIPSKLRFVTKQTNQANEPSELTKRLTMRIIPAEYIQIRAVHCESHTQWYNYTNGIRQHTMWYDEVL